MSINPSPYYLQCLIGVLFIKLFLTHFNLRDIIQIAIYKEITNLTTHTRYNTYIFLFKMILYDLGHV